MAPIEVDLTIKMTGLLVLVPGKGKNYKSWSKTTLGEVTVACPRDKGPYAHSPYLISGWYNWTSLQECEVEIPSGKGVVKRHPDLTKTAARMWCARRKARYVNAGLVDGVNEEVQAKVVLTGGDLNVYRHAKAPDWRFRGPQIPDPKTKYKLAEVFELKAGKVTFKKDKPHFVLDLGGPEKKWYFDYKDGKATVWLVNLTRTALRELYKAKGKPPGGNYPERDESFENYYALSDKKVRRKRIPVNQNWKNGKTWHGNVAIMTASGPFCPAVLMDRE